MWRAACHQACFCPTNNNHRASPSARKDRRVPYSAWPSHMYRAGRPRRALEVIRCTRNRPCAPGSLSMGVAGSSAIAADMSSTARIVAGTNNARRSADNSRSVIVPWRHGLQSLDKQTASFLIKSAAQAVRLAAITCIVLRADQQPQLLHVEGVKQECCASNYVKTGFFSLRRVQLALLSSFLLRFGGGY